jgi:hypothetical protein
VVSVDQQDLLGAGTLRDAFEQTVDVADSVRRARGTGALEFEGLRVRPLALRVFADLQVREISFQQHIARDRDQREGERHGHEQADAEAERRALLAAATSREQPPIPTRSSGAAERRMLRRRVRGLLTHSSLLVSAAGEH